MIKKNIPNLLTSMNLLCGSLAGILALNNLFEAAFFMVLLGNFFDLFDGFSARLLKSESPFGLQFDSMADMVTSGVVPGIVVYQLFWISGFRATSFAFTMMDYTFTFSILPVAFLSFLIPLGAAIRLSNYNLIAKKHEDFRGLPAPASALFIVSLPLLVEHPHFYFLKPAILSFSGLCTVCVVSFLAMNTNIRLLTFKMYHFSPYEYRYQYAFFLISIPMLIIFQWVAIPMLVAIYVLLSLIRSLF